MVYLYYLFFGGTYKQAPFEDITEEEYNNRIKSLKSIDLTKVDGTR